MIQMLPCSLITENLVFIRQQVSQLLNLSFQGPFSLFTSFVLHQLCIHFFKLQEQNIKLILQ